MKAFLLVIVCLSIHLCNCGPEEEEGVKYADKCEGIGFVDNVIWKIIFAG